MQTGGINQGMAAQGHGFGTTKGTAEGAVFFNHHVFKWRMKYTLPAMVFKVALQSQHQAVAVDNTGGRRQQGRLTVQRGFQSQYLLPVQFDQVINLVGPCLGL